MDETGRGFPELLSELFANDPEVSELAWLEWAMHCAFTAVDSVPLDVQGFTQATAGFEEEDWGNLRLNFLPGTSVRRIVTYCDSIWKALSKDSERPTTILLDEPAGIIVWREELLPVFQRITELEAESIQCMRSGGSFADLCEFLVCECGEDGVTKAGEMLARWIAQGQISGARADSASGNLAIPRGT